jgi:hypothetical protein
MIDHSRLPRARLRLYRYYTTHTIPGWLTPAALVALALLVIALLALGPLLAGH